MNETLDENHLPMLEPHEIAYKKLTTIAKALNLCWCPNWEDVEEYKYFPWFALRREKESDLLCIYCSNYVVLRESGFSGAIASKSGKIATYFGEQFGDLWKEYLLAK